MPGRILLPVRVSRVSLTRRRVCSWLLLPLAQGLVFARAEGSTVGSARMWPAQEYTRLILEAPVPMAHELKVMKNPDRLVLDLEDVELNAELIGLPQRVLPNDPYVRAIRVALYRPGVVRVVLDLKVEVNAQLFALNPVGEYGHRVVLDLYPLTPADPLMALLQGDHGERGRESAAGDSAAGKAAPENESPATRSVANGKR